jgi:hypothetical protein
MNIEFAPHFTVKLQKLLQEIVMGQRVIDYIFEAVNTK